MHHRAVWETKEQKMRLNRKYLYLMILVLSEVDRFENIYKCCNDIVTSKKDLIVSFHFQNNKLFYEEDNFLLNGLS